MSDDRLFVIGDVTRLPRRPRDAIEARRVLSLDQAESAVAVAPLDGDWSPYWSLLRQAFQDFGLGINATWIDERDWSRKPRLPWPGSTWSFPSTRSNVVWYRLCRDPKGYDAGNCTILFDGSKHFGKTLREVPISYLDWLLGENWLQPDSFLGRMIRLHVGRLATGNLSYLSEEPFDTRGFSPLDAQPGTTIGSQMIEEDDPAEVHWRTPPESSRRTTFRIRKPGNWFVGRSRLQCEAEDEAINQVWWSDKEGNRLKRHQGLGIEPMPVLIARKARNRVYWGVVNQEPVIKGGKDEGDRVRGWDRALEALDRVSSASDLDDLDLRYQRAAGLVEALAMSEDLDPDDNSLKEELDILYRTRRDSLERREESLSDFQTTWVTNSARKGKHRGIGLSRQASDMQEARVTEIVRWLRGCRTLDDLKDVALWISNNRDLFEKDSMEKLRRWYGHFRDEISKTNLNELMEKCGSREPVAVTA